MVQVRGEILIDRPPDAVFDFVADERNEPRFNPRVSDCELQTEGPIGVGSRFRATARSAGRAVPMTVEFTGYDRPRRLASHSSVPGAEIDGELVFEPEGSSTRMRWSWDVRTRGPAWLVGPVVSRLGDRQERRTWEHLKTFLEADGKDPSVSVGPAPRPSRQSPFREMRRRAYRGGRASGPIRSVNRAQGFLHAIGIWPSRLARLEVRGRRTGRIVSLPVVIADYQGERYLVAMLGEGSGWVRNVTAAGGRAVLRHGRTERVRLEPVPVWDRAPILRRYLECAPGARAHIPVDRRAPVESFEAVAAGIPVFRIRPEPAPLE